MLKAHHEMRAMGLRERFSFAPDRDDVRIRLGDRLGEMVTSNSFFKWEL
jgi:hypothetical protein